ncbi:MAG TPA: formate transporter FocA [Bacteroides sp.]|nr:formate transporter FocA [Bacteroides sp.]
METNINAALLPPEMARKAEEIGVSKARIGPLTTSALAVLAGAFIAFGAVFSIVVITGSTMDYGVTRLLAGVAFSLGLILVVVGGAELFTGNNLMIMAWANKKVKTSDVLKNWIIVYVGNMFGALSVVLLIFLSGHYLFGGGLVGLKMMDIANAKCQLGFVQAITLGILCNILVCLAIWLCLSAKSTHGKILSIIFPITAFVAAGFEHSVANMYFIPMGIAVKKWGGTEFFINLDVSPDKYASLTWGNFFNGNLLPVTIGNIIGGAIFVGLAYWFIYLRKETKLP